MAGDSNDARLVREVTEYCNSFAKDRMSAERLVALVYYKLAELRTSSGIGVETLKEDLDPGSVGSLRTAASECLATLASREASSFRVADIVKMSGSRIADGIERVTVREAFVRSLL